MGVLSDVVVVADVRPRFVVEVGEIESIENVSGVVIGESLSWSFRFAFDALTDAEAAARRLAEELEHVRIVDREPGAAVPVGVPDGAEGCSECMPGEGLLPSARVVLDGCACGRLPKSILRAGAGR